MGKISCTDLFNFTMGLYHFKPAETRQLVNTCTVNQENAFVENGVGYFHLPFPEYIIRIALVRVSVRIALVRVELHSLGLGVSVSPLFALVSVELHS